MNKRLDFVRSLYDGVMQKMREHKDLSMDLSSYKEGGSPYFYYEPFANFKKANAGLFSDPKYTDLKLNDALFNYFMDCDPTSRKKYVQWLVILFKEYHIKAKENGERIESMGRIGGSMYTFFEDLPKVYDAINTYEYLKLTKTFNVEDKQINKFKDYKDLIELVHPYIAVEGDANVHTLDHKELKLLQNPDQAVVFADTHKHIIVVTKTKESNAEFGKYSTWCTAGTRWGTQMFDNYNNKGPLFVVIKKGHGSKDSISKNANSRIQLHFETKSYMDANDRPIVLHKLLSEDLELKDAFRKYFETVYLKKIQINQESINFLLELGYADIMMDMLAVVQPKDLNLSNYKIEESHLRKLFKITSIETLDLSSTDISYLPDEIRELKNLKKLKISNNEKLTTVPIWISNFSKLEILDISGCDICGTIDLTGLTNLKQFIADFNTHLTELPIGIASCQRLERLNVSYCNILKVDLPGNMASLELLDVHENPNLSYISDDTLANTPKLSVLATACTQITKNRVAELYTLSGRDNLNIINF